MHLVDIVRETNATGVCSIYAIGDLHADLKAFDDARAHEYIKHIAADPFSIAIFVGDALDGRVPGRRHFDAGAVRVDYLENLKSYVNHGLDELELLFRPLIRANVPLVCVSGNHDDYLEEIGLTVELIRRLGGSARYLGAEGFVRIRTGTKRASSKSASLYTTVVHATHGSGGGKRPGSKVNNLQATLEWVDADVVISGHVHDGDIRILPCYGVPRSGSTLELIKSPRVLYRAPGFVKRAVVGIDSYLGRKGFPSTDEGLQYVRLDPHNKRATRYELEL